MTLSGYATRAAIPQFDQRFPDNIHDITRDNPVEYGQGVTMDRSAGTERIRRIPFLGRIFRSYVTIGHRCRAIAIRLGRL